MPETRRKSLPADPDARKRRASAHASFQKALKLVNDQRDKLGHAPLSPKRTVELNVEIEAASAWYRKVSVRPTLTISAAEKAVADLSALVEKVGRLIADGGTVDLLAKSSPETPIASFKWLMQDEATLDARESLRSRAEVAQARQAHAAVNQFAQKMQSRLTAWKQIAPQSRGTGSIQSKALGSRQVQVLWGLLETWVQYTTQVEASGEKRKPPDIGKPFETFAKASVVALRGNLRASISAARKRYHPTAPGWPRWQWVNGIRKSN